MTITPKTPVTLHGVTHTVAEWRKKNGINSSVFANRLTNGWPLEKALTTSPLSRSAAGTRSASKMRFIFGCVGKPSPEFIPGQRKPRADRPRLRSTSERDNPS